MAEKLSTPQHHSTRHSTLHYQSRDYLRGEYAEVRRLILGANSCCFTTQTISLAPTWCFCGLFWRLGAVNPVQSPIPMKREVPSSSLSLFPIIEASYRQD